MNWFHHLWNKSAGGKQDRDKSSRRGKERKERAEHQGNSARFLLLLFEWPDDFPLYKVVVQITTRGLISIKCRAIRKPEFNVSWKCSQAFVILFPSSSLLLSCPWMPQTLLSQLQPSKFYPSIKDVVKERTRDVNLLHLHFHDSWGASGKERGCWSWFRRPMAWGQRAGSLPGSDTGGSPRDLDLLQTPFSVLIKISKFSPVKLLEKIKSDDTLCCWGLGSRYFRTLLLGV